MIVMFCLHLVAFGQYYLMEEQLHLPVSWKFQSYVLFVLSAALCLAVPVLSNSYWRTVLYLFHGVVFLMLGFPLGDYINLELTLLMAVIIEGCLYLSSPLWMVLPGATVVLSLFFQRPVSAWGETLPGPSRHDLFFYAVYAVLFVVVGTLFRTLQDRLAAQRESSEGLRNSILRLTNANELFQNYATLVEEESKLSERKRLSRDIHDVVGYAFNNLIMMLEVAGDLIDRDSEALRGKLREAVDHAQVSLAEVRKTVRGMRTVGHRGSIGLEALQRLKDAVESATPMEVHIEYGNLPWELDERIDEVIYRLVQEAITNAFRHGNATLVYVYLWCNDSGIDVSVRDNGGGCVDMQEGIGLAGMRERIDMLGGFFSVGNVFDGFTVFAHIPWKDKKGQAHDSGSIGR